MSNHHFTASLSDGREVRVYVGWAILSGGFFLHVIDGQNRCVLSSLDWPERPGTLAPVIGACREIGIQIPDPVLSTLYAEERAQCDGVIAHLREKRLYNQLAGAL